MKSLRFFILLIISLTLFFIFGCKKVDDKEQQSIENEDTTTVPFIKRGLVLDTRSTDGLPKAKVSIYASTTNNTDTLLGSTETDSNGFFKLMFVYRKFNAGFKYVFLHPNPVFMNRTYNNDRHSEKINDSTELFYLHRKSACRIALKNIDAKQKNVMLFNSDQKLSKLMMNLRKDTTIYYLLQDYTDVIYFDYFPQKNLQQIPVRGSTSGDTLDIEFKY